MSILVGGWKLLELQPCNLPERVATGFSQVMGSMIGATYTPVLYVAKQIVSGENHMILCKQSLSTAEPEEHLTKIVLYDNMTDWSLISIEQIV